ncbi:MAG: hypothetical protein COB76_05025 [Alphaproteobacteria bacterium]|nr:MAG: hypothetical protein COB76_05025 [Alphaproteobacteria bacterium]
MPNTLNIKTANIDIHANGYKQIFTAFSRALSPAVFYDYRTLTENLSGLQANETAAIGGGVMIFHGWLDDWAEHTTSFIQLRKPFEALNTPDRAPVDLILLLLSPRSDGPAHLSRLSSLTRAMRNVEFCDMLRGATSKEAVEALFDRADRRRKAA